MLEEQIIISNTTGLHARPATKLVAAASKFASTVEVIAGDKVVNAKSIVSVLTAGIGTGTEVTLRVAGDDEADAFAAVSEYLHNLPD